MCACALCVYMCVCVCVCVCMHVHVHKFNMIWECMGVHSTIHLPDYERNQALYWHSHCYRGQLQNWSDICLVPPQCVLPLIYSRLCPYMLSLSSVHVFTCECVYKKLWFDMPFKLSLTVCMYSTWYTRKTWQTLMTRRTSFVMCRYNRCSPRHQGQEWFDHKPQCLLTSIYARTCPAWPAIWIHTSLTERASNFPRIMCKYALGKGR